MNKTIVSVPYVLLESLLAMANSHVEDIDSGLEDGTYDAADNTDIDDKHKVIDQATALLSTAGKPGAKQFFNELLNEVETLTGVAEQYGNRTLADLMYLHSAIGTGGFIDCYPGESNVLEIVNQLPSKDEWLKFIKIEYLSEPMSQPAEVNS